MPQILLTCDSSIHRRTENKNTHLPLSTCTVKNSCLSELRLSNRYFMILEILSFSTKGGTHNTGELFLVTSEMFFPNLHRLWLIGFVEISLFTLLIISLGINSNISFEHVKKLKTSLRFNLF